MKDNALYPEIDKPMLLCFHRSFSGSFHLMQPVIKDLKEDYREKLIIIILEKGENGEMEILYNINYFPTLLLIWKDQIVTRLCGLINREELYDHVDQLLLEVDQFHCKLKKEK